MNETISNFVDALHRVERLYCSYTDSDVLHDVDSVTLTDTDIHVQFTDHTFDLTRFLTVPLSCTHRLYRNRFELCDKHSDIIMTIESTGVDFFKLTLNQEDITL